MNTASPTSTAARLDHFEKLLSGLFSPDAAPWLRELRFKRPSDPGHNLMTVPRTGPGPSPAPNLETRG